MIDVVTSRLGHPSRTFAQSSPNCHQNALNTVGTHNQRIFSQKLRNRLREGGLLTRRPYAGSPLTQARVGCVVWRAPRRPPLR